MDDSQRAAESEPEDFRRADVRLHLAVGEVARSKLIFDGAFDVQARLTEILTALAMVRQSGLHSHNQHAAIIDAIASGDPDAARDAMHEHLLGTQELIAAWGGAASHT